MKRLEPICLFAGRICAHLLRLLGSIGIKHAWAEAHRARGNYAYVGIATYYFRQRSKPLVLGLTASLGGSEEKIAEVCENLGITAIEHRTDEDKDVKLYIQPIEVEWRRVKPPEQYLAVRDRLRQMLIERVKECRPLAF
jgi:Fanconi anemia group M protein